MIAGILLAVQFVVTVIVGIYFYRQLKGRDEERYTPRGGYHRDLDRLQAMRRISLTEPLAEKARPTHIDDIIGQADGIRALRAALCGANPQHVIIYGAPGVGKTCAARLVLEDAKRAPDTPFRPDAPFIEMDATCVRFDERAIADPLIGSVHDPIYQGAGSLGVSGVPQPKEGAVTRAHGGVLFLDEIGELHPIQMNKLLKVLEDRVVRLESAYYDPTDGKTPRHIHDIFENGLPADFRLIGATTRMPEELPPALRSRCMEVYFRALDEDELALIASQAAARTAYTLSPDDAAFIAHYAQNGRDAVNLTQMAAGLAQTAGRRAVARDDLEWLVACGRYAPRPSHRTRVPLPGRVNGLAVYGASEGAVIELEAVTHPGSGKITVTGIVEEEELSGVGQQKLRRTATALAAAKNALTLIQCLGEDIRARDVHINFPGGAPVDGPSAGVAMCVALYSALRGLPVRGDVAMTGEISVCGDVLPVGGVPAKINAAIKAGLSLVLIPAENDQARFHRLPIEVRAVSNFREALDFALGAERGARKASMIAPSLAAEGIAPG